MTVDRALGLTIFFSFLVMGILVIAGLSQRPAQAQSTAERSQAEAQRRITAHDMGDGTRCYVYHDISISISCVRL